MSTLADCESSLTKALENDATFSQLASGVRLLGRAKSLYSIMRKLLRLQDPAAGSRRLGQMYDLLGLRAVVLPREDLPAGEAEAAAVKACYRLQVCVHRGRGGGQGCLCQFCSRRRAQVCGGGGNGVGLAGTSQIRLG